MSVNHLTIKTFRKISEVVFLSTEPMPDWLSVWTQSRPLGEFTSSNRGNRQAPLLSNIFNRGWYCTSANNFNNWMPVQVQSVTVNKPVVGGVNQSIFQVYKYHQASTEDAGQHHPVLAQIKIFWGILASVGLGDRFVFLFQGVSKLFHRR
jgi:hypothetical protein